MEERACLHETASCHMFVMYSTGNPRAQPSKKPSQLHVHTCIQVDVCACIHACVCACVHACVVTPALTGSSGSGMYMS